MLDPFFYDTILLGYPGIPPAAKDRPQAAVKGVRARST